MTFLKYASAINVSSIVVIIIVWYFVYYRDVKYDCIGKLKFRSFLNLYSVAEHKWNLHNGNVVYSDTGMPWGREYPYYFSPIDTYRYILWKKINENKIKNQKNHVEMERAVKNWQIDIRNYCEKNNIPLREEPKE